ncbi:hypothetical protein BDZ97DRAFT_208873 [Flammula alnicola]|nr:hypothetical protein BDZ97DRAFT_208873 [Flammula alnicola]
MPCQWSVHGYGSQMRWLAAMTSVAMARATPFQPIFSSPRAEELSLHPANMSSLRVMHPATTLQCPPLQREACLMPQSHTPIPVDNPLPTSRSLCRSD